MNLVVCDWEEISRPCSEVTELSLQRSGRQQCLPAASPSFQPSSASVFKWAMELESEGFDVPLAETAMP